MRRLPHDRWLTTCRSSLVLVMLLCLGLALAAAAPPKPCDLMKMLMSVDNETAQKGIDGFVKMGADAVTPLICFIAGKAAGAPTPNELGKRRGEIALVRIGSKAVPGLLDNLGTKDEALRTRLVRVLGQIKDIRRNEPLMKLWANETSDRVRSALVAAIASVKTDPAEAMVLFRARIAVAGPRELQALMVQFAMHGTDADLHAVIARVDTHTRPAFLRAAIRQLREIGGELAHKGIGRLEALK